jgi:hypothetical protein
MPRYMGKVAGLSPLAYKYIVLDAHAELNPHVSDWVFSGNKAAKKALFRAYEGLDDNEKDALDHEVRGVMPSSLTVYRSVRPGQPLDRGGSSVTDDLSTRTGEVHAWRITPADVLLHYGQKESWLASKAYGHEREIILKPNAKPKYLGPVEQRVASAARVASRHMQAGESFPEMQSAVDRLYEDGVIDYPIEVRYFGPIGTGTVEIQLLKEGLPGALVGHFFTSKVADGWESPQSLRGVSPECLKAYKKIRRKHKGAGFWTVQWAFLKDESLFRQGLGRMAYEKILHEAGMFGAVVAPAWCATGGSTSPMAERVWASVAKRHPTEGPLVVPRNI